MPGEFDKSFPIAGVYATALFELARAADRVDDVRAELAELAELDKRDRDFAAFIRASAIDKDEREISLERMFRGRLSDDVLNTLQVMNQHGRLGLLPELLRAYVLQVEEARGQVEVTVTSAVPLDEAQREEARRIAGDLSGRAPVVEYVVDPSVLGGLIVQIGDRRLDNSLRCHLRSVRSRLLEKTTRAAMFEGSPDKGRHDEAQSR